MKRVLAFILIFIFSTTLTAGCGKKQPAKAEKYTVTFITDGKSQEVSVESGKTVKFNQPQKDGFIFDGWYESESFDGNKIDLLTFRIVKNMTLYARFEKVMTEIKTVDEFLSMTDGNYVLSCDLDFTGVEFTPIGSMQQPFSGIFDGNGHTIKNVEGALSVFGVVSGSIKNLTAEYDIHAENLTGTVYCGGIAGYLKGGIIENCVSKANINVTCIDDRLSVYAGGIAGRNSGGKISSCVAYSDILTQNIAEIYCGGIVGYNGGEGSVKAQTLSCAHFGSISGKVSRDKAAVYAGGIAGYNAGIISDSYSVSGSITGECSTYNAYAGGIVGDNNSGRIYRSIAGSDVTAKSSGGDLFAGGVTGHNFLGYEVVGCYAFNGQKVIAESSLENARRVFTPCKTVSAKQLNSAEFYLSLGLNGFNIDDGYMPYLNGMKKKSFAKSAPLGSMGNPIEISTLQQLKDMNYDKAYILTADIEAGEWSPKGSYTQPFTGSLDGNGHKIYSVKAVNDGNYVGIFGFLNGTVKNLEVEIEYIQSANTSGRLFAGGISAYAQNAVIENCKTTVNFDLKTSNIIASGICGYMDGGSIDNCESGGTIKVQADGRSVSVGGVCGVAENATLSGSKNTASISATLSLGGFIGGVVAKNTGTAQNCGNTANISATCTVAGEEKCSLIVGGLSAENVGKITNSYSAGELVCSGNSLIVAGSFCGNNNGEIDKCCVLAGKNALGFSPVPTDISEVNKDELERFIAELETGETAVISAGGLFESEA